MLMSMELKMLAWSIVLGIVHVLIGATLATQQRGLAWNASARDGVPKPLTGVAARVDRATRNFLETFVFFAAAILAVVIAQKTNSWTALGAQVYFWSRVAYLPVYAAGIPFLRTAVWAASVYGMVQIIAALF
ncbi:MAG: MAPEG family protein [Dokdonella sp.]